MVSPEHKRRYVAASALLVALLAADSTRAGVTAKVDRNTIDLNESFVLELIVDFDTDLKPDVTPLEADFYVGPPSEITNTMIVNNQITRTRTWTYQLRAKETGELEIPPIAVGTEQSRPLHITVREPSDAPPGEADVFITSEVDQTETYVQAQVLYRIKIYRAVPTRQNALRDPVFGGVEVLTEIVGDERSYEALLNGRTYIVNERVYALFPQESGEVTISPARFEARVLRGGRITGRKLFESERRTVDVLPIPAPPADYPTAAWLPARDVELYDSWSREPGELSAGEPITRNITVSALGQLESQIPVVAPPVVDGVNVYPDKPELSRRIEPAGIRGVRKDQYAMIGVESGEMRLPSFELPWFDVTAVEWRVASLPERTITVLPSADPPMADPVAPTPVPSVKSDAADVPSMASDFWRRVAEFVAILWFLTLVAWWWSLRPKRRPREPEPPPLHRQQARHLKNARKAALAGDAAGVRKSLLEWARMQWPDNAPRSIGALADRVSAPLADELTRLSDAVYGPNAEDWDGPALAKALRSFAAIDEKESHSEDGPLPPLMPQS